MEAESVMYSGVYREISDLLGTEAMRKLYRHFRGQQVSFPIRLYDPQKIRQSVIREYDGTNLRELAAKYDYSEKTIRRMLRDGR